MENQLGLIEKATSLEGNDIMNELRSRLGLQQIDELSTAMLRLGFEFKHRYIVIDIHDQQSATEMSMSLTSYVSRSAYMSNPSLSKDPYIFETWFRGGFSQALDELQSFLSRVPAGT